MIVEIPPYENIYDVFRWLEEHIGLYGRGWTIVYDQRVGREIRYQSFKIDADEDALAYKLVYNI